MVSRAASGGALALQTQPATRSQPESLSQKKNTKKKSKIPPPAQQLYTLLTSFTICYRRWKNPQRRAERTKTERNNLSPLTVTIRMETLLAKDHDSFICNMHGAFIRDTAPVNESSLLQKNPDNLGNTRIYMHVCIYVYICIHTHTHSHIYV